MKRLFQMICLCLPAVSTFAVGHHTSSGMSTGGSGPNVYNTVSSSSSTSTSAPVDTESQNAADTKAPDGSNSATNTSTDNNSPQSSSSDNGAEAPASDPNNDDLVKEAHATTGQ